MKRIKILTCLLALAAWIAAPQLAAESLPKAPGVSAGSVSATGMVVMFESLYTGMVALQVTGTWAGSLNPQCSVDVGSGATFESVNAYRATTGLGSQVITGNGIYRLDTNGCGQVQIQAGSITSGTALLSMRAAPGALPPPAQMPSSALTLSPTPSHTPTSTPTATPSFTNSPTASPTRTASTTPTPTPTRTVTP